MRTIKDKTVCEIIGDILKGLWVLFLIVGVPILAEFAMSFV